MTTSRGRLAGLAGQLSPAALAPVASAAGGSPDAAAGVVAPLPVPSARGPFTPDQGHPSDVDLGPTGNPMDHFRHTPPPPGQTRPFLSQNKDFGTVSRGDPVIPSLDDAVLAAAGLTEKTWSLDIRADPFVEPPHVKLPAAIEKGPLAKLDMESLRELGRKQGTVKVVKAMQCLNLDSPLGQGLWEGVPLSTVLRACCGKMENVRRINFWGFHNNDPAQVFRSSVSYLEAMEPAYGEPPVFLCYAMNGEPLPVGRGGPVRMIVPHAHGFKSVKWLQHITVTNDYRELDTYAAMDLIGNDPHSALKTYATLEMAQPQVRPGTTLKAAFSPAPPVPFGQPVVLSGVVMNGRTPVSHIEYWVRSIGDGFTGPELEEDDTALLAGPWQRVEVPPPPQDWSAALPANTAPGEVFGLQADGKPSLRWPLPYSYTAWSATVASLPPGDYEIRARSVDLNGFAQPEPRPMKKNGRNAIMVRRVTVAPAEAEVGAR